MSVLLQISDTHFGTEQPPVVEALVRFARAQAPDVVVLSGDITQRARRKQFRAARAFVDRLGSAVLLAVPGNHDIPLFNVTARLLHPYANHRRVFGEELEPSFESADLLVVCVNTTRPKRHKNGEVSARQIARVAGRLRRATDEQLRIVVTHQPVHIIRPEDKENLLRGHEPAIRAWSSAGADVVMGGHIHLPYMRPLRDRFPDLPRAVWAVQAGTAVSRRIRERIPNSVNLVRYPHVETERGCLVERWDYDAATQRFEMAEHIALALDR